MLSSVRGTSTYRGPEDHSAGHRIRILLTILIVFLVWYRLFTFFFAAGVRVEADGMEPTISAGDGLIVSRMSYGLPLPFTDARIGEADPEYDDLVVFTPNEVRPAPAILRAADGIVRLLSFERLTLRNLHGREWEPGTRVARVIAGPGDTVFMESWHYRVQPEGSNTSRPDLDERDGSVRMQRPETRIPPDVVVPLSGNMSAVTLADDEFWLAGDNRGRAFDSVHTGPVSRSQIHARVVFRFRPLPRFGGLR
ncbi:MAG: signal peptidase I [Spirochaetaceae bacterium]